MIAKERRKEKRRFRRGWSLRREIDAGGKSPVVSEPGFGGEGGIQTFFSDANKIKDLASRILVKIAQGHQKGHQKNP